MTTTAGKIVAAQLTTGTRILVQRTDADGQVAVALRKTGDEVLAAKVTKVEPVKRCRFTGRQITTDAGMVAVAASQRFMLAKPAPAKAAKVAPAKGTACPPAPGKRQRIDHHGHGHPLTPKARAVCRAELAKLAAAAG